MRGMKNMTALMMATLFAVSLAGCERYALDRQMAELCKKDGGIKVYEKVTLSAAEFEAQSKYVITKKSEEDYYGPEYRYVSTSKHLVGNDNSAAKGRGELSRIYSAIYRRSDGQLLGESVWYARVGGDLFTFGFQPSGKICPRPRVDLAQSIFIKGE